MGGRQVKKFNVSFFEIEADPRPIDEVFNALVDKYESVKLEETYYKLVTEKHGNMFCCEFKKYTNDYLPHAGKLDSEERELALEEDEFLISKNFFVYDCTKNRLAWQNHRPASNTRQLIDYIFALENVLCSFNPVISHDDAYKILNERIVHSIDLRVARPQNATTYNPKDFSSDIIKMINSTHSMNINLHISAFRNRRGKLGLNSEWLINEIKGLFGHGVVTSAKALIDDIEHPVDLFLKTYTDIIKVPMIEKYPVKDGVFKELIETLKRCNE